MRSQMLAQGEFGRTQLAMVLFEVGGSLVNAFDVVGHVRNVFKLFAAVGANERGIGLVEERFTRIDFSLFRRQILVEMVGLEFGILEGKETEVAAEAREQFGEVIVGAVANQLRLVSRRRQGRFEEVADVVLSGVDVGGAVVAERAFERLLVLDAHVVGDSRFR